MHSFEVNIRICQPENSDVHLGLGEHHFRGLTNPDFNQKIMHKIILVYDSIFIFIKNVCGRVPWL